MLHDYWVLQVQIAHCLECGVQSFPYVLVGRIRELVNNTNEIAVPSETLFQNIFGGDMRWKPSGAFNLDSIVENSHVNIVRDGVVAMQYGIGDNFMQRCSRIGDRFQSLRSKNLNLADD